MLQHEISTKKPVEGDVDLLTVGVSDLRFRGVLGSLDKALSGLLKKQAEEEGFKAKKKESLLVYTNGMVKARRVLLVGLDKKLSALEAARLVAAQAASRAHDLNLKTMGFVLSGPAGDAGDALSGAVNGAELSSYRFNKYKSKDPEDSSLEKVLYFVSRQGAKGAKAAFGKALAVASGTVLARDLGNEPSSVLTPVELERRCRELAEEKGMEIEVLTPTEMEEKGMGLIRAVGQGSVNPPRMITLIYKPRGKKKRKPPVAFVGKGVTFDSGGLSLKPSGAMLNMHMDMCGAAAVVGAMSAVADVKPERTVFGIVGAAENMPDGKSYKLNDVIKGMNGKTVEVTNTDAEGRLVLGDALCLAVEKGAEEIIDLATLTGAALVALGLKTAPIMGTDKKMLERVKTASESAGESTWPLPLLDDIRDDLKSDVADFKNSGSRNGGSIAGGAFLREFVDQKSWVHIDVAGPSHSEKVEAHIRKGGTGFGVATLIEYLLQK